MALNPKKVERYLEFVFRLSRIWDCFVLLDEADIFPEERNLSDLERNALVCVFLRSLKYFEGILILTSNRARTFDQAFKSRIQLAIHYQNLSVPRHRRIWGNLLGRLKEMGEISIDFEDIYDNLDDLARCNINGRAIRNAITTARQLAQFKDKVMSFADLEHVINIASKFDEYIQSVRDGITDDEIREREIGEKVHV